MEHNAVRNICNDKVFYQSIFRRPSEGMYFRAWCFFFFSFLLIITLIRRATIGEGVTVTERRKESDFRGKKKNSRSLCNTFISARFFFKSSKYHNSFRHAILSAESCFYVLRLNRSNEKRIIAKKCARKLKMTELCD